MSARITARRCSVLASVALLAACQSVPESSPQLPDLSRCDLASSFVLGDAFDYPASIEIWQCQRNTIVTLNQFLGLWPDRIRQVRSHLATQIGPGEQVVGCRKDAADFSGIVAVTSHDDALRPTVLRTWKADLDNWVFETTAPESVVCNY